MVRRCAQKVFVLVIAVLVAIEVWNLTGVGNEEISAYDGNHVKLLRDYYARRHKKIHTVIKNSEHLNSSAHKPKSYNDQNIDNPVNVIIEEDSPHVTNIGDVLIAVRSTSKYHDSRLRLLMDTWIPLAKQSTYVITDGHSVLRDEVGEDNFIVTECRESHARVDLVCKLSVAYDLYMVKPRRWFCMCDDDTYINIPNLVVLLAGYDHTKDYYIGTPSLSHPMALNTKHSREFFWFHTGGAGYCISRAVALKMVPYASGGKLRSLADRYRLPDDVAVGYIVNKLLNVEITRNNRFHSHLEPLHSLNPNEIREQITLSYSFLDPKHSKENLINTGRVIPTYSPDVDPTRLMSVHCYLFQYAAECKRLGKATFS